MRIEMTDNEFTETEQSLLEVTEELISSLLAHVEPDNTIRVGAAWVINTVETLTETLIKYSRLIDATKVLLENIKETDVSE